MTYLSRLLREPLLHFFVIGGLFFVAFFAVNDSEPPPADVVVITPERIAQLAAGFTSVWKREPTDEELEGLIDADVREEIFYREALALGLDTNDTVIRRRLHQKMEFLTDAGADLLEPSDDELEDYLAANNDVFRQDARLAFEQIYLGENPDGDSAASLLNTLQSDPAVDPTSLGERTLLPHRLDLSPPSAVDGVFGNGFFDLDRRAGDRRLDGTRRLRLRISISCASANSVPPEMPALDEVREAVLRDWKDAKAKELSEAYYDRLRERYTVEIQRGRRRTGG